MNFRPRIPRWMNATLIDFYVNVAVLTVGATKPVSLSFSIFCDVRGKQKYTYAGTAGADRVYSALRNNLQNAWYPRLNPQPLPCLYRMDLVFRRGCGTRSHHGWVEYYGPLSSCASEGKRIEEIIIGSEMCTFISLSQSSPLHRACFVPPFRTHPSRRFSMATCLYVVIQLFSLSPSDPIYLVLLSSYHAR